MTEDPEVLRRLGTTLRDKWKLTRVLGVGGMAAVYVGQHKIGREDAIKILHPEVARSKNVRARFEQEAHAVNRFKHPGVVEIRDFDVAEDGAPFLVMELLEGDSLSGRLKRNNGMETPELLRVIDDMLDVLAAAHAQGIIHRDIKPDNVFLLNDGRVKVLDFGIARMREGAPKTMHTKIGSTLGTIAYMAPEQTMSSKIDERADLFAVGATMFRILARRYIHEASSETELLVKMASDPAPPLASVAPHVPAEICLIVDRSLAFEKARRYPDARTMQADVRAVRNGLPPPYAAERLRAEGPPSPVRASAASLVPGAALASGASGDPMRDNPTVMPGKSGGGSTAGSLPAGAAASANAAAMLGSAATIMALPASDDRLGMTSTSFSVPTPPSYNPPAPIRVIANNAPSPSASVPPAVNRSTPPVSGVPSVSVPPVAVSSAPMGGRPSNPSSPSYVPTLTRSLSHKVTPQERAREIVDRARPVVAGAIAKIPENKRRPALYGAIAFAVLLVGFFLWLGLSGSDSGRARDDSTRGADSDRSRSSEDPDPSGSDPSSDEAKPEEPPQPTYQGKGKSKKRRPVILY